jgi:hypothetical protein
LLFRVEESPVRADRRGNFTGRHACTLLRRKKDMFQNDEHNSVRRRPRRRVRFDGVIEETTVMGRTFTIPAEPLRQGVDVSAGADGWEPLRTFLSGRRSW